MHMNKEISNRTTSVVKLNSEYRITIEVTRVTSVRARSSSTRLYPDPHQSGISPRYPPSRVTPAKASYQMVENIVNRIKSTCTLEKIRKDRRKSEKMGKSKFNVKFNSFYFLEDAVILSRLVATFEEHMKLLDNVLEMVTEANPSLNPQKCVPVANKILGMNLSTAFQKSHNSEATKTYLRPKSVEARTANDNKKN